MQFRVSLSFLHLSLPLSLTAIQMLAREKYEKEFGLKSLASCLDQGEIGLGQEINNLAKCFLFGGGSVKGYFVWACGWNLLILGDLNIPEREVCQPVGSQLVQNKPQWYGQLDNCFHTSHTLHKRMLLLCFNLRLQIIDYKTKSCTLCMLAKFQIFIISIANV